MSKYAFIRIDKETHERISKAAAENFRTISGQVKWMVEHSEDVVHIPLIGKIGEEEK
jgi:hypothetical protein